MAGNLLINRSTMNIKLYSREKGVGTPLVLLHGNGEDGTYFESQMEYFSSKYRVIAVDTRGHGRSPRGGKKFCLDTFADDLNDFFVYTGLPPAHLLGFSDGGNIALLFALKHPEKIKSLILNGANLFPDGMTEETHSEIQAQYQKFRKNGDIKNMELFELMLNEPDINPAELQKVTVPALIIAGDRDMIKEEHTRLIAGSLPMAELKIIPGSHFIAKENPLTFNREVEAFLRKI